MAVDGMKLYRIDGIKLYRKAVDGMKVYRMCASCQDLPHVCRSLLRATGAGPPF